MGLIGSNVHVTALQAPSANPTVSESRTLDTENSPLTQRGWSLLHCKCSVFGLHPHRELSIPCNWGWPWTAGTSPGSLCPRRGWPRAPAWSDCVPVYANDASTASHVFYIYTPQPWCCWSWLKHATCTIPPSLSDEGWLNPSQDLS